MQKRLNVSMVKAQNRKLVFNQIMTNKKNSRLNISKFTHLSIGTVSTIVDELIESGIIREVKDNTSTIGRKPKLIEILPSERMVICLDLATGNFSCTIKKLDLSTAHQISAVEKKNKSFGENLKLFLEDIKKHITETGMIDNIIGIGISVPGPYLPEEDRVLCNMTAGEKDLRINEIVNGYFDLPVFIDHDVKLAALSEIHFIPGMEHLSIFYLFLDKGIGGALCINGEVYGGANDFAGEIGQMCIDGKATLEQVISIDTLFKNMGINTTEIDDMEQVEILKEKYDSKDPALLKEIKNTIKILSRTLSYMVCICNPDTVIIGGRYKFFGETFLERIKEELEEYLIPEHKKNLELRLSNYVEKSPLIGAAGMVIENWLNNQ